MKKVLIIAFYFPPLGGGGVQRPLKFVKYLPEFGWQPVVLTVKPILFKYVRDNKLMDEIPSSVKIYRAPFIDIRRLPLMGGSPGKIFYRPIERKYLIPGFEVLWNKFAIRKALKIIEKETIDIIFTTAPPHSINLVGYELKKKTGLPWVADLRDEWTTDPARKEYYEKLPMERLNKEIVLEKKILNYADKLITISDLTKKRLIQRNKLADEKFAIISNGYDEADFYDYSINEVRNDKLIILYSGNLSTRNFEPFLQSLHELVITGKIDSNKIEVKFFTSSRVNHIKKYINGSYIKIEKYLPHFELIKEMGKANLLLLVIDSGENSVITGKLFEYLRSKKNIFAVIPSTGVAAKIISKCKAGIISEVNDKKEIKKNLLFTYNNWLNDNLVYSGIDKEIKKFDRRTLTYNLASFLSGIV